MVRFRSLLLSKLTVIVDLLERTFSDLPAFLTTTFLEDIRDVLGCCKESLRLMGYDSLDFQLSLKYDGDQHLQHIYGTMAPVEAVSTAQAGHAFIQLLRIVVPITMNYFLVPQREAGLEWLIEMLQDVNVLDRFLRLIVNYNLCWLFETLLSLDNVAVKIFVAQALGSAVFGNHHQLIRLFLKHGVSLKRAYIRDRSEYSALGIALILNHDTTSVRLLLDAKADPYFLLLSDPSYRLASSLVACSDDITLPRPEMVNFRYLLASWVAEFKPKILYLWRSALKAVLRSGNTYVCGIILENLVRCVQKQLQDLCVSLLRDICERRPLSEHTISQQARDLELFRNHKTCQTILDAIIGIAIAILETDDLVPFCSLKQRFSANYASSIIWAMEASSRMDTDKILLLCHNFDVDLSECLEISPFCGMMRDDLSGLLRLFFKHGATPHQGINCLLPRAHREHLFNEDPELFNSLLQSTDTAAPEQNMCFFTTLAFSGDPSLLARAVEHFENRTLPLQGARRIFEEPEFLLWITTLEEDTEMLLWLLKFGISFESFNRALANGFGLLPRFSGFAHPPSTLQAAFASGLRPCSALLIMCALGCSNSAVENVRLVVEAANAQETPFSRQDLTFCLDEMIELVSSIGKNKEFDRCPSRDERYRQCLSFRRSRTGVGWPKDTDQVLDTFRTHMSAFKYLVKLGAECSNRWLEQDLFSELADVDDFRRESFIHAASPLHMAVRLRKDDLVHDLLARGLFLDERASCGLWVDNITALQLACWLGNSKAVDTLLQAGANINYPADSDRGITALQGAASSGHMPIIIRLLQLGADINAPAAENEGRTALEAAAERGRLDAVQLLINNNPDLRLLQKDCKRASRLAHRLHKTAIGDMLKTRARELAEELGIQYEDEIDSMCKCQIARKNWDWCELCDRSKEAAKRYREKEYEAYSLCRKQRS